ncbi:hypothetical protein ACTTAL_09695 [Rhodobacter capsulatus]
MSVSTLEDALRWLITYTNPEEWIFHPDAHLPQAALFACDMFWISPADLCKKLRDLWPDVRTSARVCAAVQRRKLPLYRRAR